MPGASDPRAVVRFGREDFEMVRAAARLSGHASGRGDGVATFAREAAVERARGLVAARAAGAVGGTVVRGPSAVGVTLPAGAGLSSRLDRGAAVATEAAAPSPPDLAAELEASLRQVRVDRWLVERRVVAVSSQAAGLIAKQRVDVLDSRGRRRAAGMSEPAGVLEQGVWVNGERVE